MKKLIISIFLLFLAACASAPAATVVKTEPPKARYIFSDKNGLYGLLDENGNEILPAQYLYIDIVKDAMIPAFTTGKEFVFLDETGKKIKDVSFHDINPSYTEDLLGVADPETGKWGFVDRNLNYVIKPQFEDVWGFIDGIALVITQNGLRGIIDKTGKYIVDPQFDDPKGYPWYYDYYQGTFVVLKDGKIRIVDVKNAKILETEYDRFYGMTGNKAIVRKDSSVYLNSWENNEIFLMKEPDGSLYFNRRNAWGNNRFYLEYTEKRENKYYKHFIVFDSSNGEKICDKILEDERVENLDENCNLKEKENDSPTALNNGKYEAVWRDTCAEESSILFKQNGKKGFLDENGKEITPAEYDEVEAFCQGLAWVRKDDQRFIIDRSGKTVFEIKPEWRYVKEVNFVDKEFYYWGIMSFYKTNGWEDRDSLEKLFFPYIEMFFKHNPQSLFK